MLFTHAVPMLEAVDQVAQEHEPNPALYRMLTGALRTLAQRSSPLVTPAFFWKLLSLEGFHPMLDDCARCGRRQAARRRRARRVRSRRGRRAVPGVRAGGGRPLSPAALDLLRRMLGGALNGVLAEPPSAAAHEVEHLGIRALEHHGERRLRSTALL